MASIAYVNGRYLPRDQAAISIEDRGFQFGDSVYEVFAVVAGRPVDAEPHLDRLERSLAAIRLSPPMGRAALRVIMGELIRRNRVRFGLVYLQISRGAAPRGHAFPAAARASVVATARSLSPAAGEVLARDGIRVVTVPEVRWARRDIKTTNLLPNVLARQQAAEAGAYEALFVDEAGVVTEGAASNAWIVDREGRLVTHPADHNVLHGVTRGTVMALARGQGLAVVERPFRLSEAKSAREVFLTSATSFVMPVTRIDDCVVANGAPGAIAAGLRARYRAAVGVRAGTIGGPE